jgi:hypothetical protein
MAETTRFTLIFDVEGGFEEGLRRMMGGFDNASSAADRAAVHVRDASQAIDTALNSMRALGNTGEQIMNAGLTYFQSIGDFASKGMQSIKPLEAMMQRMQGVAHETEAGARDIVANAIQLAEQTPFLAEDVSSLSSALAIAKVNLGAFQGLDIGMAAEKGFSKLPAQILDMGKTMKVTATSMLADIATVAGVGPQRMQFFVAGMQRALTTGNLRMLDELPPTFKKAIFGSITQSKIPAQQAMENLFKFLSKEGQIGAALAGSTTMEAIESNFADLPGKLFRNVFGMPGTGGFYDQYKDLMRDVYTTLSATFADADFLNVVKDALTPIFAMALKAARALSELGKRLLVFVKEHPQLAKYSMVFLGITASVLVLGGVLIKAASAVGMLMLGIMGLQVSFMTWGAKIGQVLSLLKSISLVSLGIIGVLGLLYVAYETNFGGMRDFVNKLVIGIRAVSEGLSNMTRTTTSLSKETAASLADIGILDFVLSILAWGNRLYNFIISIGEGFSAAFEWGPQLGKVTSAFSFLSDAVRTLFSRFGDLLAQIPGMGPAFQESSDAGGSFGVILGTVASGLVNVAAFIGYVIGGIVTLVDWIIEAGDMFAKYLVGSIADLVHAIGTLNDAFTALMSADFRTFFSKLKSGFGELNAVGAEDVFKKPVAATPTTATAVAAGAFAKPAELMAGYKAANQDLPIASAANPAIAAAAPRPISNVVPLAPSQIRRGANPQNVEAIQQAVQDAAVNASAQVNMAGGGMRAAAGGGGQPVNVQVYVDSEPVAARVQQRLDRNVARQIGG